LIEVICITEDSYLTYLKVSGHASKDRNNTIICSAVSCLTRTVCEITTRLKGVSSKCSAPNPGDVLLTIERVNENIKDRFCGITDYLLIGIIGVVRDYPDSVTLKINNKEWYDGSQKRWW